MANSIGHANEARSNNFLFTIGEDRQTTMAVQSSNVTGMVLGQTPFPSGAKDLMVASNKVDNDPVQLSIILSEDYREMVTIYKWMLRCKNNNAAHISEIKTCQLIALDSQNRESTKFVYQDCLPVEMTGIELMVNEDQSNILVCNVTLAYNKFKIITSTGEEIDETYGK
jgi:hypothetical protein